MRLNYRENANASSVSNGEPRAGREGYSSSSGGDHAPGGVAVEVGVNVDVGPGQPRRARGARARNNFEMIRSVVLRVSGARGERACQGPVGGGSSGDNSMVTARGEGATRGEGEERERRREMILRQS